MDDGEDNSRSEEVRCCADAPRNKIKCVISRAHVVAALRLPFGGRESEMHPTSSEVLVNPGQ